MAEYYRSIFTIRDDNIRGLDLLEKVGSEVHKWAEYEFGKPVDGERGDLEGDQGRLRYGKRELGDTGIFGLVWERPGSEDVDPLWRLSLRLATEGDDMEADIEVRGMEGREREFEARPPEIVSIIFTGFHCVLDGRRLTPCARFVSNKDIGSFQKELIDPDRSAPLLAVSEGTMPADLLQVRLLGLVTVIWYDRDTAWEISKNLPRPLRCYDGAIRLYTPGCSENDVSQQHPYWLPADVDKLGEKRMYRILQDECVNRLSRYGRRRLFSRMRDEIRRQEIMNLESKLKQQAMDDDTLLSLFEMADYEDVVPLSRYKILLRQARMFKNRADTLAYQLGQPNESKKALRNVAATSKSERQSSEASFIQSSENATNNSADKPDNVSEVVKWAVYELDGLRFLPHSIKTAESVSKAGQFKKTEKLLHLFQMMSDCAGKRSTGLGTNLVDWFRDRGVLYAAHESEDTWARYRNDRTFFDADSGEYRYMEEHFKLNDDNFELRIHVDWDKKQKTWLIGYVGPHLPTSSDPH